VPFRDLFFLLIIFVVLEMSKIVIDCMVNCCSGELLFGRAVAQENCCSGELLFKPTVVQANCYLRKLLSLLNVI
jgi:hypothetical protein